jgi:hypothetical protein
MGARLGMQETSVGELLKRKDDFGLIPQYEYADELVLESFKDDLPRSLTSLRFRTFGSHNDFCRRLHAAIKLEHNIEVEPLWCNTSQELQETPVLYANNFDCLTVAPLSTRHAIWLDFHKPLSLPPDRCSNLFFVQNRAILEPFTAGSTVAENLELYEQAVAL